MINGVPGSNIINYALRFRAAVLTHGQQFVISVLGQNGTYKSTCVSSYAITQKQGNKRGVLLSGVITNAYACQPNTHWA
jgi:signal recognition particle GTPase